MGLPEAEWVAHAGHNVMGVGRGYDMGGGVCWPLDSRAMGGQWTTESCHRGMKSDTAGVEMVLGFDVARTTSGGLL